MTEPKRGDRVRLTLEGEVRQLEESQYLQVRTDSGTAKWFAFVDIDVEIIEKPLAVGDVATDSNKHLLPKSKYILADKDGDSWERFPSADGPAAEGYAPFTLVYIHPESE